MVGCVQLIAEAGVDAKRFKPLEKVHKINTTKNGIACNFPHCKFTLRFVKTLDKQVGKEVFIFREKIFSNTHNGRFH